ncbi:hypothetical protein BVRB_2g024210 [Beta vulgaris subsp. vulgaris]|nr:hypothetical protein BVRB_2g024210 [Beta vulgaris subsp. vulgaris]
MALYCACARRSHDMVQAVGHLLARAYARPALTSKFYCAAPSCIGLNFMILTIQKCVSGMYKIKFHECLHCIRVVVCFFCARLKHPPGSVPCEPLFGFTSYILRCTT